MWKRRWIAAVVLLLACSFAQGQSGSVRHVSTKPDTTTPAACSPEGMVVVVNQGADAGEHACCEDIGGGTLRWQDCDVGAGGGGGTPGGSSGQVQYNNAGSFAGDADLTFDGTTLTATAIDVSGGSLIAPEATTQGTCDATTVGRIKRVEGTAIWPYTGICSSDGAGGYIWLDLTEAGSTGFVPVDFEPDFYLDTVDTVTEYTVTEATIANPIGVLSDGALYGSGRTDWTGTTGDYGDLFKSTDGGQTWTKISDLSSVIGTGPACSAFGLTPPCAANMTNIVDTGDGEVIVTTRFEALKSSGWAGGSPTWSIVLEPTYTNTTDTFHRGTFLPWAIDSWGQYVLISEYLAGGTVAWDNSRYIYLSSDSGSTFSTVYDIQAVEPGVKNHIHGVAIDPWVMTGGTPRLWISHHNSTGGGPASANAMTRYSDNLGSTWTTANTFQPTTLRAAKYGLVMGVDYEPEGMQRVLRRDDPTDMEPEYMVEFDWHFNSSGFSRTAWRDPRTGIVYDAYGGINADSPSHIQVSDGRVGNIVFWTFPDNTGTDLETYWGVWVTWASGEDIMVVSSDDNGTDKYYTMAAPQRGQFPDRIRNLGHLWPVAERAGAGSTVVGIDALGGTTGVTVLGYRARAEDINSVVIGDRAVSTEPDTVIIGEGASTYDTAAAESVIIGGDATGTFNSVIIGDNTSSTANNVIAIGPDLTVTGSGAVVMGVNASCASGACVSVGNNADQTHASGRGVAIGNAAQAIGYKSVAVGTGATTGIQDSTIIGDNASSAGTNQRTVIIGSDASGLGNDQTVIGDLASANANGGVVVVGDDASSTQINCTVLGSGASCASSGSVALGQATSTSGANQVAIGNRTIVSDDGTYTGTWTSETRTASRTWTFPDASGTIALASGGTSYTTFLSGWRNGDPDNSGTASIDSTTLKVWESYVPFPVKFDTIAVYVQAAYTSATDCAVCVYGPANSSGVSSKVACAEGASVATALGSTGVQTVSVTEATVDAGVAWVGFTCNDIGGTLRAVAGTQTGTGLGGCGLIEGTSAGTAMPASIDLTTETCIGNSQAVVWMKLYDSVPALP